MKMPISVMETTFKEVFSSPTSSPIPAAKAPNLDIEIPSTKSISGTITLNQIMLGVAALIVVGGIIYLVQNHYKTTVIEQHRNH